MKNKKKILRFILKVVLYKIKYKETIQTVSDDNETKVRYYYDWESDVRFPVKILILIILGLVMLPFRGILYIIELYKELFSDELITGQLSSNSQLSKIQILYYM